MDKGELTLQLADGSVLKTGSDSTIVAHMKVHSDQLWSRVAMFGDIGFAESYMAGEWESDNLTDLLRWFLLNIENTPGVSGSRSKLVLMNSLQWLNKYFHWQRANTRKGSEKNIREHYDLSNDFFSLFLDSSMTYSSGIFLQSEDTLEQAQQNKYDRLCREAGIRAGDEVLEIGTGWGGFAIHAAKNYGAKVTTVTISKQQYEFAVQRVKNIGLENQITILLKDYRDVTGKFDKVVSIEMIEAVGYKYLQPYFEKIQEVLKPDGVLALQAIICPDNRFDLLRKRVDFIQKHIFPGSLLPSIAAINQSVNATGDLFMFGLKDLGKSYVKTLNTWQSQFNSNLERIYQMGFDDQFIRKWNYYFSYCEAAFDMRNINVVQLIYTRPNNFLFGERTIV
jgi:cyclopropane-fatty-acyl-phospholipid synthase